MTKQKEKVNNIVSTDKGKIDLNTFWKLTYADGEVEYSQFAPYDLNNLTQYERLESMGNPIVKFEKVASDMKDIIFDSKFEIPVGDEQESK